MAAIVVSRKSAYARKIKSPGWLCVFNSVLINLSFETPSVYIFIFRQHPKKCRENAKGKEEKSGSG
jgi:hypothetical protein